MCRSKAQHGVACSCHRYGLFSCAVFEESDFLVKPAGQTSARAFSIRHEATAPDLGLDTAGLNQALGTCAAVTRQKRLPGGQGGFLKTLEKATFGHRESAGMCTRGELI